MEQLIAYSGNKEYIFISYSHRDSGRVLPIIAALEKEGFRCWYDEGIDPGTEWDENIAQHMRECSYVIAFVSKNYLLSENCKDELNYARDKDKPRLLVYLEEVSLPEGMAMRLNRLQAVFWYKYQDEAVALQKIVGANQIGICREPKKEQSKKPDAEGSPGGQTLSDAEPAASGAAQNDWKKFIPLICLLAVIAALLLLLLFVILGKDEEKPQPQSSEPVVSQESEPESSPEPEVSEEVHEVHITLTAHEEMGIKGFREAVSILRDRLDLFAGTDNYRMEVGEETVELYIPEEVFGEDDISVVLRMYLSRAIRIYFFDAATVPSYSPIIPKEYIEVSPAEVENVEFLSDMPAEVDPSGLDEDTEYRFIRLSLSEEFVKQNKPVMDRWEDICFGQDVLNPSNYYYYRIAIADDGRTVYLIHRGETFERFEKLIAYNYTHPPLEESFYYEIEPMYEWEKLSETETPGVRQCDEAQVTGDYVIVTYKLSWGTLTEGKRLDTVSIMKKRLDALGQPYAFGRIRNSDKIVVKTTLEHLSTDILNMLGSTSGSLNLRSGLVEYTAPVSEYQVTQDGESAVLTGVINKYSKEKLSLFLQTYENVELWFAGRQLETTKIDFDDKNVTVETAAENQWLLDLIAVMADGGDLPAVYAVEDTAFGSDDSEKQVTERDYGINFCEQEADVTEKIRSILPKAEVKFEQTVVKVSLNLPVDESLPEEALRLSEEICRAIDFDHSVWTRLLIYLTEENNEYGERARVFFTKSIGIYDVSEGRIEAGGIFCRGRLDLYKDAFRQAVEKNDFLDTYENDEWSWVYE